LKRDKLLKNEEPEDIIYLSGFSPLNGTTIEKILLFGKKVAYRVANSEDVNVEGLLEIIGMLLGYDYETVAYLDDDNSFSKDMNEFHNLLRYAIENFGDRELEWLAKFLKVVKPPAPETEE